MSDSTRTGTALLAVTLVTVLAFAQTPPERPFWRPALTGTFGMAAAEHPFEARAAMDVLREGGNAIDAAVAAFYMTTVVEPHQAGIGGDAFMLAYLAKEDRVVFINGTGPAPRRATREFYEKLGGIPDAGPYSTDVPGAVAGFDVALKKYGTRDYETILKAAIEAASNGYPLSHWQASQHARNLEKIKPYPASMAILTDGGDAPLPGWLFVQKDLARSLETIAAEGAEAFYRGRLAKLSTDFYRKHDGLLDGEDLASFEAEEAEPVKTVFHDLEVFESPPNSQGIALLIALNILEGYDLAALGYNTPEYLHVVAEALKLAFADRDHYIADPRFAKDMPVRELLSKDYAKVRRGLIRPDRALRKQAPPGDPRRNRPAAEGHEAVYEDGPQPVETAGAPGVEGETSSYSIADRFGNVVSVTHSVNAGFGSGMIVEGGGYVLNDRMPYFSLDPDDVNVLEPGKRPRHTINPAIAFKNGKPVLAWNTSGGDTQVQTMLQAFLNLVVFGMNVQQAVEAPCLISTAFPASMYPQKTGGTLILPRVLAEAAEALAGKGHRVEITPLQRPYNQAPSGAGAVKMVYIDPETGVMQGGVSPAKDNYALGW